MHYLRADHRRISAVSALTSPDMSLALLKSLREIWFRRVERQRERVAGGKGPVS